MRRRRLVATPVGTALVLSTAILAPGAFISLLVPLIVFFSFQRFFVQGVLAGSVK